MTVGQNASANLDFLRAVAVLLVLGQHLSRRLHLDQSTILTPTGFLGLFGVLLFFVHTSLVLMYSLERTGLRGRDLHKDFYVRRVFRIYPLSILAVAVALALHLDSNVNDIAGLSYGPPPGTKAIISQFLLVQNLLHIKSIVNVLWSLPFEIQMYLFLPFLFAGAQRWRVVWPLLGLWMASVLAALAQPHVSVLNRATLLLFVPCFLPGVIAYALPRKAMVPALGWPLFLLILIGAYTLKPGLQMGWFLCLLLGLGIPFFHEIQAEFLRFISNRIATYSYGIYISHQFCIWFALGVLAHRAVLLRVGVLIAMLVLIPLFLYHCVEKPMIKAGVFLARRMREKSAAAPVRHAPSGILVERA
jgi:peptidoglycan/LPS O-acetylase OafA/YrhL